METSPDAPSQPTRMERAAVQVAAFTSNRWVMFTQKFILVVVGVIILVDLFLAFNRIEGDTISEVIKEWAYRRFFVLTWTWGVLAGHLFLSRSDPILGAHASVLVLLGMTLALLLAGLFFRDLVGLPMQVGLLLAGTVAGYLLWPQTPVAPVTPVT